MSPRIEALQTVEADHAPFFTVDLMGEEAFDATRFDELTRQVGERRGAVTSLKYLVQNNVMFLFPTTADHAKFYEAVPRGKVQSAGFVYVIATQDGFVKRTIDGHSSSLDHSNKLGKRESSEYRKTLIAEKLATYFEIE